MDKIERGWLIAASQAAKPRGHVAEQVTPAFPAKQVPSGVCVQNLAAPTSSAGEFQIVALGGHVEQLPKRIG